jgi:mRNA-degrading endonuclease RelE of RelBE toxin-antitoxin system
MYQLRFTPSALEDLKWFSRSEQRQIAQGIEQQVPYEPTVATRNRKTLRPNKTSDWELRIGKFRVFYDADAEEQVVKIKAVGQKEGNRLLVRGEEYEL